MPLSPSSSRGGSTSRFDLGLKGMGIFSAITQPFNEQNVVAPAAGSIQGTMLGLLAGDICTNIIVNVNTTASGTAPTLIRLGIYDTSLNLLASTNNLNSSGLFGTAGYVVCPLSAAFTVSLDGSYYGAIIKVGTFSVTQPTFFAMTSSSNAGKSLAGAPRVAWQQTGQTDLTNPATAADSPGNAIWFGIS